MKNDAPTPPRSKWQLACDAFQRDLPRLLNQGLRGQWVLYDGAKLVEKSPDRDLLYDLARDGGLADDDIFVDLVTPAVQDIDADLATH